LTFFGTELQNFSDRGSFTQKPRFCYFRTFPVHAPALRPLGLEQI